MLCFKSCLLTISNSIQLNISQTKTSSEEAFESMAAKGVFCFVLFSALVALATSLPEAMGGSQGQAAQVLLGKARGCNCINPFLGTANENKGDPESLCKSDKQCYIPCNASCYDIQATSNASRCKSKFSCDRL